jgi:alkylhydroperoxidase family enzyme
VLRLGLDHEGLGEVIAVTDLFNGLNRVADAYQIEPDVKPAVEEVSRSC